MQCQGNVIGISSCVRNVNQNLSICDGAVYGIVAGGGNGYNLSGNGSHALGIAFDGNAAVIQMDGNAV